MSVGEYIANMEFEGMSPNTIKGYGWTTRTFLQDFFEKDPRLVTKEEILTITKEDVRAWLMKMDRRVSKRSVARHLHALRSFLGFCGSDVAKAIKTPRFKRRSPRWLREETIDMMIEAGNLRSKAMITLGYECGLRVGEIVALNRDDYSREGYVAVRPKGTTEEKQILPCRPEAIELIDRYVATRRDNDEALFVTPTGRRLSPYRVEKALRRLAQDVGAVPLGMGAIPQPDGKLSWHILRHSLATNLIAKALEAGEEPPFFTVNRLMRHKRAETTFLYIDLLPVALKKRLEKLLKRKPA